MTLEQFLEALEKTPRGTWTLVREQYIRCVDGRCPLSALRHRPAWEWSLAAVELGIAASDSHAIIDSADSGGKYYSADLRAKLLKACGLCA